MKEKWGSRTGFILAAIGSAIGLGNIWRFPYMAYQNGGGAFLIPYLLALFVTGIPLLIMEFGLGNYTLSSAPGAFRKIRPSLEFLGWIAISIAFFGILAYYSVVISWTVNYFVYASPISHRGELLGWGADPNKFFFTEYLRLSSKPGELGMPNFYIVLALLFVWFINWFITSRGVKRGIELANKIFMPLLLALIGILILRGITLPGAIEGIKWYLKPDFSKLSSFSVWRDAFSQIFFSLSLGFGIMIAYSSYTSKEEDVVSDGIITAIANSGFSLYAGFAVFSMMGYLAYSTGEPFGKVVKESIGLAFVTYPAALNAIPFLKSFFAMIFFLALILAGISSAISLLEAFAIAVIEKFSISRRKTITALSIIGFSISIVYTTKGGLHILDVVDHFLLNFGLVTVGFLEVIFIAWVFGSEKLSGYLSTKTKIHLGKEFIFVTRFVLPVILGILITVGLREEIQKVYGGYPKKFVILWGVGALLLSLIVALVLTMVKRKTKDAV